MSSSLWMLPAFALVCASLTGLRLSGEGDAMATLDRAASRSQVQPQPLSQKQSLSQMQASSQMQSLSQMQRLGLRAAASVGLLLALLCCVRIEGPLLGSLAWLGVLAAAVAAMRLVWPLAPRMFARSATLGAAAALAVMLMAVMLGEIR